MKVEELQKLLSSFCPKDEVAIRLTGFLGDDEVGRLVKVELPILTGGDDDFAFERIRDDLGTHVVVLTGRP